MQMSLSVLARFPWKRTACNGLLLVCVACETKEIGSPNVFVNPTVVDAAATSIPPLTVVDAAAPTTDATPGSGSPLGINQNDGGAIVSLPDASALDAGSTGASTDASLAADAALRGDASGGGGELVGPVTLPDPAMPGPYGVEVEENIGKGFENPIDTNDTAGNNKYCEDFALSFGQDEAQSKEFAKIPATLNMALFTLFRPAKFEAGKKYPILSWGNGTCALPQGYGNLLKQVASHGFWVIAAHSRFVGDGVAQRKGIDVMVALSKDPTHAAYNRVDAEKVGIFGHSQGGLSTSAASDDVRVDAAAILNAGGGGGRIPTYYVTGEQDLAPFLSELSYATASAPAASINFKMSDHITLITEPMRIYPSVVAWFRYQLLGDEVGKSYFVGPSCKLCNHASEWSYEQKNLK